MPSRDGSLTLARGITPIPHLDTEILHTIPSHGTGSSLNTRQLLLLLRLRLRERSVRATAIWDLKGRTSKLYRDFYDGLSEAELAEVGVKRVRVGGETRDGDGGRDRVRGREFKVVDAGWVAGWRIGVDGGRGGNGIGGVENRDWGIVLDMPVDAGFVEGADTALALLGSQLNAPVDDEGRMKVLVIWLHSMDVQATQAIPKRRNGGEEVELDNDADEHEEVDRHTRGLLLDTSHITVGKFLHQIDAAITQTYPHRHWAVMKLSKVELGACDDDKLDEENPHPDSEKVLECLEIFVGYEFVGEKDARAAREIWERDYWSQGYRRVMDELLREIWR
ncbi:hypothetical protein BKA64DRAFT_706411 [Cadophora sp. MPI-SDFR-AT-0126]|nr:hypothetical protein BKA64DRAFT_706411 [Leotiomycetes sp. MPI-SDFR-AT-0126]